MYLFQDIVYKSSSPVYRFLRILGILPYTREDPGRAEFKIISRIMGYSFVLFLLLLVWIFVSFFVHSIRDLLYLKTFYFAGICNFYSCG